MCRAYGGLGVCQAQLHLLAAFIGLGQVTTFWGYAAKRVLGALFSYTSGPLACLSDCQAKASVICAAMPSSLLDGCQSELGKKNKKTTL